MVDIERTATIGGRSLIAGHGSFLFRNDDSGARGANQRAAIQICRPTGKSAGNRWGTRPQAAAVQPTIAQLLFLFKSEKSGALVGQYALVAFGEHAVFRILHAQLQPFALFQLKRDEVMGVSR